MLHRLLCTKGQQTKHRQATLDAFAYYNITFYIVIVILNNQYIAFRNIAFRSIIIKYFMCYYSNGINIFLYLDSMPNISLIHKRMTSDVSR
jgi:hypothetical protein